MLDLLTDVMLSKCYSFIVRVILYEWVISSLCCLGYLERKRSFHKKEGTRNGKFRISKSTVNSTSCSFAGGTGCVAAKATFKE